MSYAEFNKRVTEIMQQTVHADGIIDLFDKDSVEISLFDEAFLTEVAKHEGKEWSLCESLKRLIKERVHAYQRTSVVKARKFSEMLQGYAQLVSQWNAHQCRGHRRAYQKWPKT